MIFSALVESIKHRKIKSLSLLVASSTSSRSRRHKMGWIELATPITHLWYLKGSISYISILLNIRKKKNKQCILLKTLSSIKSYKHKLNHENIHRLLKQMMLFYLMTRTILMGNGYTFSTNWIRFISAKSCSVDFPVSKLIK
jgi:DNA-directed RNA polymerase beta' subunit